MNVNQLKQEFFQLYGKSDAAIRTFFSPGRVNLIGEHTDYNGGLVFPCALSFGTYLIVRKTDEKTIKFASTNFDFKITLSLDKITEKQGSEWVNYPLGVINQFQKKGIALCGLELLYAGDIPNGAGLSSSASIEVVTAFALNILLDSNLDRIELVKLSQKAENEFVGVNCGIMDQFAVGMGKKDHAIALQCDTLKYDMVPLKLGDYKLLISNTNKRRGLADSKYNERRAECEKAVAYINKFRPLKNLGELSYVDFAAIQEKIPEEIIRMRAHHVVAEDQRVVDAIDALKQGELDVFGELMNASHDSLRDDYEVTGIELDTLVDEARKIKGVIGSRMTGAGFGGCTVTLIKADAIDKFKKSVAENYTKITGLTPEFYVADIGDGVKELEN
jgi:galactokinase